MLRLELKAITIFPKRSILDLWQEYAHLSVNIKLRSDPAQCIVRENMQSLAYYRKFRYILAYSCSIQTYSAILWYI